MEVSKPYVIFILKKKRRVDDCYLQFLRNKEFAEASNYLRANSHLIELVMQDVFTTDYRRLQLHAHVFDELKQGYQQLLQPFYKSWIAQIGTSTHEAFHRSSYRYFQDVDIPEELQGVLYDFAFRDMMKPEQPIAVRVFAMTTCYNIAQHYKELLPELHQAITMVSESDSPGIRSRSRRLLAKIGQTLP